MNTVSGYGRPGPEVTPANESRWLRWFGEGLESGRTGAGASQRGVNGVVGHANHWVQ